MQVTECHFHECMALIQVLSLTDHGHLLIKRAQYSLMIDVCLFELQEVHAVMTNST